MNQVIVFLLSMLPIIESRLAIPFGIGALQMNPWEALAFGLAGNILTVFILLHLLDPVTKFLRKNAWLNEKIEWLFHKTRTKHDKRMSELGHIALIIFVAIPLPGSGAWSGSLVAYLFGVKKKLATLLISTGLVIAGLIITLTTEGITHLV